MRIERFKLSVKDDWDSFIITDIKSTEISIVLYSCVMVAVDPLVFLYVNVSAKVFFLCLSILFLD